MGPNAPRLANITSERKGSVIVSSTMQASSRSRRSTRALPRELARVVLLAACALALVASASSSQQKPAVGSYQTNPPPPQAMDPALALGLWKSSFGAVKIENDGQGGANAVHGVWVYDRGGQEIIGYFGGALRGNVLELTWQEPGQDGQPLEGAGYLVFDPYGKRFSGRWWTTARDRMGDWTGWRQDEGIAPRGDYGGQAYGDGYVPPPEP